MQYIMQNISPPKNRGRANCASEKGKREENALRPPATKSLSGLIFCANPSKRHRKPKSRAKAKTAAEIKNSFLKDVFFILRILFS